MAVRDHDPKRGLGRERSRVENTMENGARLAHAYARWPSTGWGELQFEDGVVFGTAFTEMPYVSYAWALDPANEDQEVEEGHVPHCSGGVSEWMINKKGLYIGAWCAVVIIDHGFTGSSSEPTDQPDYSLMHMFTFSGIGMKLPQFIEGSDG